MCPDGFKDTVSRLLLQAFLPEVLLLCNIAEFLQQHGSGHLMHADVDFVDVIEPDYKIDHVFI